MPIAGVRRGIFATAYKAVVAHLKAHPLLANERTIRAWHTWEGAGCPAEPPVDKMPAIHIRLIGGPMDRFAGARTSGGPGETASNARVMVAFEVWTKGQDVADLADVGEMVYDALFPQDRAERSSLESKFSRAGIADHKMVRPILPVAAESYGATCIAGQGMLEIIIQIDS